MNHEDWKKGVTYDQLPPEAKYNPYNYKIRCKKCDHVFIMMNGTYDTVKQYTEACTGTPCKHYLPNFEKCGGTEYYFEGFSDELPEENENLHDTNDAKETKGGCGCGKR